MKDECIYTSSPHICLCCAQGQIYISFCNMFPSSLFIKCPVVSCVQIMECSNVLVTQHKKTEFFTSGLPDMKLVTACSSLVALIKYLEVRYWVMAVWCDGSVVRWQCGVMSVWCDGSVMWWQCGVMVDWCDGSMVWWECGVMAVWFDDCVVCW